MRDHVRLGDHVLVAAQTGITRNIEPHESMMGTPALPSRESTQIWIASQRLPEMKKELKELKASVAMLQAMLSNSTQPNSKAA